MLEFTCTRSLAAMSEGVTFTVEWSPTGVIEVAPPLFDNGIVQTLKATLPASASGTGLCISA